MKSTSDFNCDGSSTDAIATLLALCADHPNKKYDLLETLEITLETLRHLPESWTVLGNPTGSEMEEDLDVDEVQMAIARLEYISETLRLA